MLLTLFLLTWTVSAFALYYRRLQRLSEEYEEAKNTVEDIVISFNKELQVEKARIGALAQKTEALPFQRENVTKRMRKLETELRQIAEKVKETPEIERKVSAETERLDKKLHNAIITQKGLAEKIGEIEKMVSQPLVRPGPSIQTVIPLKREKALEPLTDTELTVLNVLADNGRKTAPEIRSEIKLTREHTARLMKKLYDKGYLERETGKIPYVYRVNKEMLKILKKTKE